MVQIDLVTEKSQHEDKWTDRRDEPIVRFLFAHIQKLVKIPNNYIKWLQHAKEKQVYSIPGSNH